MKLLDIAINPPLLLQSHFFEDQNKNIDHLVKLALGSDYREESLSLMLRAAELCEKFHSYFHFEGGYIYNLYGQKLEQEQRFLEAITQYKMAIFQSHLCKQAHISLINCYDKLGLLDDKKQALDYINSFRVDISNKNIPPLARPYEKFSDYVLFATENRNYKNFLHKEGFWLYINESIKFFSEDLIVQAISELKKSHEAYHKNAAMIYYNCSLLFQSLGKDEMANNALIKSKNLDATVLKLAAN